MFFFIPTWLSNDGTQAYNKFINSPAPALAQAHKSACWNQQMHMDYDVNRIWKFIVVITYTEKSISNEKFEKNRFDAIVQWQCAFIFFFSRENEWHAANTTWTKFNRLLNRNFGLNDVDVDLKKRIHFFCSSVLSCLYRSRPLCSHVSTNNNEKNFTSLFFFSIQQWLLSNFDHVSNYTQIFAQSLFDWGEKRKPWE